MKHIIGAVCLVLVLLCWAYADAAPAPYVIGNDPGGNVMQYWKKYARFIKQGRHVILKGECDSACTTVLNMPRRLVCAMPGATLGFHDAMTPDYRGVLQKDREATEWMVDSFYPNNVALWFYRQHVDSNNDVIVRRATAMGVRPC